MVERWYPSKVDWWLALVLALVPIACLGSVILTLVVGHGFVAAIASFAGVSAIYLGLVFPMRYGIDADTLVVRSGLVRQRIPLRAITEVRATRNPLSSPALSLDRLLILSGTKKLMISPAAKAEFLVELATRAGLARDADRLVRR